MDSFYPVISLLAFISGGCFGWYYAWRSGQMKVKVIPQIEPAEQQPLRKAA